MVSAAQLPLDAGVTDLVFDTSASQRMNYSLSIPEELSSTTPLILVLHYAGQPTAYYGRPLLEQLIQPALSDLNAVYVVPTSLGGDWTTPDNSAAVFELLESIQAHYHTDPTRRVVTGYSMGGIGTWYLQSLRPGYFSAAIPIAGFRSFPAEQCQTPIAMLHSSDDEIFPLSKLEPLIHGLRDEDCPVESHIISGVTHFNIAGYHDVLKTQVNWLRALWRD